MRTPIPSTPITRTMRGLSAFAGLAVFAAFTLLFIFGENTREMFAWTIQPAAVAAFLGAGYGSIVVSSILSFRAKTWAEIRIPFAVLFIGLVFILLATLLHLDRFHFSRPEFVPRNMAIGWITLYGLIPPLMVVGFISQLRAGTHVERANHPLPGWARAIYAGVALVTGVVGLGLFFVPEAVAPIWFWPLTPLLARMTAAWLLGVSSAAALTVLDNNRPRIRITAVTLMTYAVLQFIVLARYAGAVNWATPMAWVWVAVLTLLLAVNGWAWLRSMTDTREPSADSRYAFD